MFLSHLLSTLVYCLSCFASRESSRRLLVIIDVGGVAGGGIICQVFELLEEWWCSRLSCRSVDGLFREHCRTFNSLPNAQTFSLVVVNGATNKHRMPAKLSEAKCFDLAANAGGA